MKDNFNLFVLIGAIAVIAQLLFYTSVTKTKKSKSSRNRSGYNWIQFFIGLQGFTVFGLPWFTIGEKSTARYSDITDGYFNSGNEEDIEFYGHILFLLFALLISSALFKISLRAKKSVYITLMDIGLSLSCIVLGFMIMNSINEAFEVISSKRSSLFPSYFMKEFEPKFAYGILIILIAGCLNAIVQFMLFFRKEDDEDKKDLIEDSELLDESLEL